jgi:hypothetical protein
MKRDLPRLATWLLDTFADSANHESMAGDIAERYRQGRSRLWYWRQVLTAIPKGLWRKARSGDFAIRALVSGWGVVLVSVLVEQWMLHLLEGSPRGTGILPQAWTITRWVNVPGWIVLSADAYVFVAVCCVLAICIGWLVGRLNRPHNVQAVLLFVASWFSATVFTLPIFLRQIIHDWSSTKWRYDNPYFLALGLVGNMACMLCTLAGGVLSTSTSRQQLQGERR